MFNTDADFLAAKLQASCSQGMRLRFERARGAITTHYIPILKKGGLLKPCALRGSSRIGTKDLTVQNVLTGKPFLIIKENLKNKTWDVTNAEANNGLVGGIRVSQNADVRMVSFLNGDREYAKIDFKCPVQKTGLCSSHKPSNLMNINVAGRFKSITFEENPNADQLKDDFEMNAYYPGGADALEFIALVAIFEVMAHELH